MKPFLLAAIIAALALGAVRMTTAAEEKTKAEEREASIQKNIFLFSIGFTYYGPAEAGRNNLHLIVSKAGEDKGPPNIVVDLPKAQAVVIVDWLVKNGYLARAVDRYGARKFVAPTGPAYVVEVGDAYVNLVEDFGWNDRTVTMFQELRDLLPDGKPRQNVAALLDVVKAAVEKDKAAAAADKK